MTRDVARMRQEDVAAFLELTRAFYAHEQFTFDAKNSDRMIRFLLANPHVGSAYLARQDEGPVGYVVLTHCYSLEFGGPFVLLDEIFVLPEARGTGLGKRLLDVSSAYCRENGFGCLRLEVQKKNERAVGVYRTYGFRAEDRYLMSLPVF